MSTRIFLAILGVLALAVLSSGVAIRSAYRFEDLQNSIVSDNLSSVRAAEELEIALLDERGYVTKYMLDGGNTHWLSQLRQREGDFEKWMEKARDTIRVDEERDVLDRLTRVHRRYSEMRDHVIELYQQGHHNDARVLLLNEVEQLHQTAYGLSEQFLAINSRLVETVSARVRRQVRNVTIIVSVTALVTLILGSVLLWLFLYGVIMPLRRLSRDARVAMGAPDDGGLERSRDELGELGRHMRLLMTDVVETRSNLKRSRDQLATAEKLAAVGRLAAGLAHEIRNPLTAMKMWLFTLRRSISYDEKAVDKLNVVSGEIVRLESIVRQFLEFSRPPQMTESLIRLENLLNDTLSLQSHQLHQQNIEVITQFDSELPKISGDAEQLKQVMINLINNAMEAMPEGGELRIVTSKRWRSDRLHVCIRFVDTGLGMPPDVQQRVFEPFFTTKSGGTGLGLCIAATIVARHGGNLSLESSTSQGTAWSLWLPEARPRDIAVTRVADVTSSVMAG